ncbi:hypothetical protein [Actinoplanes sp. NPDC049599]|uniref:hypothetical protein n=1 Tax=Actinoplanes sp. NPDC049599 TaxID=3363903 RepID=UPI0037AB6D05
MERVFLASLFAQPGNGATVLDPGFLTVLAVILLVLGLAALRRAVQPIQELLVAAAAAGAAVLLMIVALLILGLALSRHLVP